MTAHDRKDVSFRGPSGLPLAFGTWATGETNWGPMPARDAKALLQHAWDRGFRHFDTAESYGNGRAEQLLGQALRYHIRRDRESLVIAGKSVVRDPESLEKHVLRSLRRLDSSYIDLFYIHWPRRGLSLHAAVERLFRLVDRNLIRAVGVSNINAMEYREVADSFPIAAVQSGYNMLWRDPERTIWPLVKCTKVAYSPLAQGLLARSFPVVPEWEPEDHRATTPLFTEPVWSAVHRLNQHWIRCCRETGLNPAAVALGWLLGMPRDGSASMKPSHPSAPRVDAAVVGGRTPQQIDTLTESLETVKDPANIDRTRAVLAEIEPLYREVERQLPPLPNMFGYVPRPLT